MELEILAIEFQTLSGLELDFDLEVTGFEAPQIDLMIQDSVSRQEADPADEVLVVSPDAPLVTRSGDLSLLGEHRILCSDARDRSALKRLLGHRRH